jgi:hypothetical protein
MKRSSGLLILLFWLTTASSQGINEIRIVPEEPTSNDTILVISDFSYYGNCDYGLVFNYTYTVGDTIYMLPTFCGYWDSTFCNNIDTFKIEPLTAGTYRLNIEYHQGSICPISDFDATIASYDTLISVSGTNASKTPIADLIRVYPNPASDVLHISLPPTISHADVFLLNSLGQALGQWSDVSNTLQIKVAGFSGFYALYIHDHFNNIFIHRGILN